MIANLGARGLVLGGGGYDTYRLNRTKVIPALDVALPQRPPRVALLYPRLLPLSYHPFLSLCVYPPCLTSARS